MAETRYYHGRKQNTVDQFWICKSVLDNCYLSNLLHILAKTKHFFFTFFSYFFLLETDCSVLKPWSFVNEQSQWLKSVGTIFGLTIPYSIISAVWYIVKPWLCVLTGVPVHHTVCVCVNTWIVHNKTRNMVADDEFSFQLLFLLYLVHGRWNGVNYHFGFSEQGL